MNKTTPSFMMNKCVTKIVTFIFVMAFAMKLNAQCTPQGDQTTYGTNSWIGYVYSPATNAAPFTSANYKGYVTQTETFDANYDEGAISGTNLCGTYTNGFAIRYKMKKTYTPGYYTITVGGDDGYRLSIDGGQNNVITNWQDHAYAITSGTYYFNGEVSFVFEYYENGAISRSSFKSEVAACQATAPTGITGDTYYSCDTSVTLTATGGSGTTYQWGTGQVVGENIISGATAATYAATPTANTYYWVRRSLPAPCSGYTDGVTKLVTYVNNTLGDPSVFGNFIWNAYGYNGNSATLSANKYRGYYTQDTALGFNTQTGTNSWTKATSPATSAGWTGCSLTDVNNFTFVYKRKGFACGQYSLTMTDWDDHIEVYINGVLTWSKTGYSGGYNAADKIISSSIALDANTTIEVRVRETGGDANAQLTITELTTSTAPTTITGVNTICAGNNVTLTANGTPNSYSQYQWGTGSVLGSNVIAGATTNTLTTTVNATTTYWVRIRKTNCNYYTTGATKTVTTPAAVVYNGTWSATPSINTAVEVQSNLVVSDDMSFCSCHVTNNATVTVSSEKNLTVKGKVTVDIGANLILENRASLLQTDNLVNSGNVDVIRTGSKVMRLDYSIWSSPVSGQELLDFSPLTLTNRFFTFDALGNTFSPIDPSGNYFETGKGYLIRVPYNHPLTPATYTGTFTGEPHNGNLNIALGYSDNARFNMVGNPYPSPIKVNDFIDANIGVIEGTLWFWRKTNDTNTTSYCTVTKLAYVANAAPGGTNEYAVNPNGVINTAQGFFVKAKSAGNLTFTNALRVGNSSNQFFRQALDTSLSRIWLDLTNSDNSLFSQTAIGYTADATTDYDDGIDGKAMTTGSLNIYSVIDGASLAIQGRPEFTVNDVVALGINAETAGTYTITLSNSDGIFADGQEVYLKDLATGTIHNFADGSYTFNTEAGTFNSRFEIVYTTSTLGINNPDALQSLIVYRDGKQIIAKAKNGIQQVEIFDVTGRLIYKNDAVNADNFISQPLNAAQGLVIVRVTLQNKQVASRKILLN
jgi:hypothetical protein